VINPGSISVGNATLVVANVLTCNTPMMYSALCGPALHAMRRQDRWTATENCLAPHTLPSCCFHACSALFGPLAEAGRLQMLSVPCTGLGDAQAKLLGKLGPSLRTLNIR
jgi:hypothetical protein